MSDRITLRLWEPVQAHKAMTQQLWPLLKSMLMAGHRMTIEAKTETRSTAQNSRLWAMLTEISKQVVWHGQKLSPDDWKHILSASLGKQRVAPGIDGGFVVLGQHTSKMTKAEFSDLFLIIEAFGAQQGVRFADTEWVDQETGEVCHA